MTSFDTRVLKKKKIDKELTLKVTQTGINGRIFVEFTAENDKLVLQKSFQDTYEGRKEAEGFQKSIKSIADLRRYFGISPKKPKKKVDVKLFEIGFDEKGMTTQEKKNVTRKDSGRDQES